MTKHNQWKKAVHCYLASIAFADEQVGRVLNAIEKSPHAANAIIVLWTDHGWHLGEKQHWRKFTLWERATHTPVIFVVPKGISKALAQGTKARTRVDRPVGLIDIYPTLVELCGLGENKALEGQSLVRLLADPKAKWDRPVLTTYGRNNHALRTVRWRYIRYANGSEELYDQRCRPQRMDQRGRQTGTRRANARDSQGVPKKERPGSRRLQ